jgi:hypothetical protein
MNILRSIGFAALGAALLQGCVIVNPDDTVSCAGGRRLQVVDLNMSPDRSPRAGALTVGW